MKIKYIHVKNFKSFNDQEIDLQERLLLRSISKIDCQIAGICYNKCVATFWQQKISKPE